MFALPVLNRGMNLVEFMFIYVCVHMFTYAYIYLYILYAFIYITRNIYIATDR